MSLNITEMEDWKTYCSVIISFNFGLIKNMIYLPRTVTHNFICWCIWSIGVANFFFMLAIMGGIIIHYMSYTSGESSKRSCVSVHLSVRTHISVPAGRNFLILSMIMGYGLGMMPDNFFIWSGIPDTQTKMSVSENGCHAKSIHR